MYQTTLFRRAAAALILTSVILFPMASRAEGNVQTKRPPRIWLLGRPAMDTPGEQLEHANALFMRDKKRRAQRHYKALVLRWPESAEAPIAQYEVARLLDKRGDYLEAFDEYRYLSLRYPKQYPEEAVLRSELRIAKMIKDTKKHRWFFGGVSKPGRAIPYLREILRQSPDWPGGAEVHYEVGSVYEELKRYNTAAQEYTIIPDRYPDSDLAEEAAFAKTRCLFFVARDESENDRASQRAWESLEAFMAAYPESKRTNEAERYRKTLWAHRNERDYEQSIESYEQAHSPAPFVLFRKPAKSTAEAQLKYAIELKARGRESKAQRHYRALVLRWPNSPEAAEAQYAYAKGVEAAGKELDAFEEYKYLMARYDDGYPRDDVLKREYRIAERIKDARRFSWFFGGQEKPLQCVPYFETILQQDPDGNRADEALYHIGKAYEKTKQYAPAAETYAQFLETFEDSPLAEEVAFSHAFILYITSREHADDDIARDEARKAIDYFNSRYPNSEYAKRLNSYEATLGSATDAREEDKDRHAYEEEHRGPRLTLFGRPKRKTSEEQLEYANRLRNRGSYRKARKQYNALVKKWPASPEAANAQYEYAKLLDKKGDYIKAFEEYEYLMERYAGRFPHEEVLERQFRIAKYLMDRRKGKLLFLPGFAAPERAIPLFEDIVANGPNWDRSAEARYLIGRAYDLSDQYELAIAAYTDILYKHPGSQFAEKASFGKAYDLYQLAQENPYDEKLTEATWAALTMFLNTYAKSENATEAMEYRKALYRRRAKEAYDKALYYDRIEKKTKAAQLAYRRFIEQFPNSGWTTLAEIRIQELNQKLEQSK